VNSAD